MGAMRYIQRYMGLAFVSLLIVMTSTVQVSALEATPTPDTYWAQDTLLKIVSYQRTTDGTDMHYMEIFNTSDDQLIDMQQWVLSGVFMVGTSSQKIPLTITQRAVGVLPPKHHAVIEVATTVEHASFQGSWVSQPAAGALLTAMDVSATGFKTDVYSLKTTTDSVTKKTIYDDFWVRSTISGENYTSTLTSFSVTPVQLFDDGLYDAPQYFPGKIVEVYPYSSECSPDDVSVLCGDYIKLRLDKPLADVSQFVLRTDSNSSSRTASNTFFLADYPVSQDGFITIAVDQTGKKISLTNTGGYVWIEDVYHVTSYGTTMTHYETASSDKQGYSWAVNDEGVWQWSTSPQPYAVNKITTPVVVVPACPSGKYRNPDTGMCRTVEEAVNELAACPEGQYRNPTTNRCRQLVTTSSSTAPCGEGQERNPETHRCRSIASAVAELLPCDEGYERNPATNRCRKSTTFMGATSGDGASATLATVEASNSLTTWGWALAGVASIGAVGYGVYEWREEIVRGWKTLVAKVGSK